MNNEKGSGAPAPHSLTLVIDRARWLRGEGIDSSALLRPSDKRMCCLGFLDEACGIPRESLENETSPQRIPDEPWPSWLLREGRLNSQACYGLMRANDDEFIDETQREREISILFAEHGVAVEFVVDAAPAAPKEPRL